MRGSDRGPFGRKLASASWVRDAQPAVETHIGFIETCRDPAGVRAEFEGFVAAVDREMTRRFDRLVSMAEELLSRLPWAGKGFEKDSFVRPEFTSLTVLAFANGSIPLGICLPNYDCVRTETGFKNVDLGNVCTAASPGTYDSFLSGADSSLFASHFARADQVLTGLHELIGHGSGKLLRDDGSGPNYPAGLRNPCTGKAVASHYTKGQSFGGVFGSIGGALEECRAEAPAAAAHLVAAGVARVSDRLGADGAADLLLSLDRGAVAAKGREAVGDLLLETPGAHLLEIHVARCTADVGLAARFLKLTAVDGEWLRRRDVVVARRRPRDQAPKASGA
eukprot:gene12096-4071_t